MNNYVTLNDAMMNRVNERSSIMNSNAHFRMPDGLAATKEEFKKLFDVEDWEDCKGNALAHILLYELNKLILATPNNWSKEISAVKADLMDYINDYHNLQSVDWAYYALNHMYIPDETEYKRIYDREHGPKQNNPIERGVYDGAYTGRKPSITKEKHNYCLARWNEVHDKMASLQQIANIDGAVDVDSEDAAKEIRKQIDAEWDAMTPEQQSWWKEA